MSDQYGYLANECLPHLSEETPRTVQACNSVDVTFDLV